MIIVSNTSPLTNLAAIGQFHLLRELYENVHIADGVWAELNAFGKAWPGSPEVSQADWIQRHPVQNQQLVTALRRDLDRGEAESIALAVELGADFVLLDERDGRSAAKRFGLQVIGVLGILLEAKKKGHVEAVLPFLDALRQQAGFYLSDAVYEKMRELANE